MKSKTFDVPVLLIIFRRKNTALQVIDAIAKVKPKTLYISQDGPRNKKEEKKVLETRRTVLSKVNWDCDLTVWTHNKNLGLRRHIPQAFNRFFKKEEYGIYLEDDTVPNKDFFYFQKDLLEKYRNDKRIFSINGTNFYPGLIMSKYSYYLSKLGDVWGFGLWRRSWKLYDSSMKDFNKVSKTKKYKSYFFSKRYKYYLEGFWGSIIDRRLDSWAMQLVYAAVKNNMYFVTPKVNLVNNVGAFNEGSNISIQAYYRKYGRFNSLAHPKLLEYDSNNDIVYFNNLLKNGWLRIILIRMYLFLPTGFRKILDGLLGFKLFSKV